MTLPKSLTIQLSEAENTRLEAEAKRLNLAPEALAQKILSDRLGVNPSQMTGMEAWERLRKLGEKLPLVDGVQIARESRDELLERGLF